MDIDKLLAPLTDYLNFLIDFLQCRGLDQFARLNTVSPKLLSFCLLGILLGLLIRRAKRPPIPVDETAIADRRDNDPTVGANLKAAIEQGDLLFFIPFLLAGSFILHISLLLTSRYTALDAGTYKDALNVSLTWGALQYPVQALITRVKSAARAIGRVGRSGAIVGLLIYILAMGANLGLSYYLVRAAMAILRLSAAQTLWTVFLFGILLVIVVLVCGYPFALWLQRDYGGRGSDSA